MSKTWLEKRILIKMRRLRKKKKIFDEDHKDIGEGLISKVSAAEFISAAVFRLREQLENGRDKKQV
jgi:hypothetical protein